MKQGLRTVDFTYNLPTTVHGPGGHSGWPRRPGEPLSPNLAHCYRELLISCWIWLKLTWLPGRAA